MTLISSKAEYARRDFYFSRQMSDHIRLERSKAPIRDWMYDLGVAVCGVFILIALWAVLGVVS